jgi:hypothetical protein
MLREALAATSLCDVNVALSHLCKRVEAFPVALVQGTSFVTLLLGGLAAGHLTQTWAFICA